MDWTEDDEIRYEAEKDEQKRSIVLKKLNESQKKYDEAEHNYQMTGLSGTMQTMRRHKDMIMICELALQAIDKTCGKCENR